MKNLYFFVLLCLASIVAIGQTEGITYQAVLVDNNPDEIPGVDVPSSNIPDQPLTIRFSIIDAFGFTEYQETQETQTDAYGTINLIIGEGQQTPESSVNFNQINWDGPKTLNVAIDLEAGTNFSPFSSQSLNYVPYVRHRNLEADGITNLNSTLNVNNQSAANFNGDVNIDQVLTVEDEANFFDRVTIDAAMTETDQANIDAYPLQVTGSNQGMAIQLSTPTAFRSNNFISFWNSDDEAIGRIEGFRAFTTVDNGDVIDILFLSEPDEDEAKDQEDDDNAPPAEAPTELDIYATDTYSMDLLLEIIDLYEASAAFGVNLGACIAGIGVAGDCDDAVWTAFALYLRGVQLTYFVRYNETNTGVAFESGGADYAEWLQKNNPNEIMSFGDVVGVKSGVISKNFVDAEKFMAVSKNPIVSGAMPKAEEEYKFKKVAFIGQVPVKVLGAVDKGDYILPSGNGDGMAIAVHPDEMRINDYKRIIGVAWDAYHGDELFSYINTAVGINSNDLVQEISQMQMVMNTMQEAMVQSNPSYIPYYFDVETVSLSNTAQTTRSKTMAQVVMQQYGIDGNLTALETFSEINNLMQADEMENSVFNFSKLPHLEEVLTNPTEENVKQYTAFYTSAAKRLRELVGGN
ncbi:MAG: hypothetical protein ABJN84_10815 [Flavobacteriaceae bacterium]